MINFKEILLGRTLKDEPIAFGFHIGDRLFGAPTFFSLDNYVSSINSDKPITVDTVSFSNQQIQQTMDVGYNLCIGKSVAPDLIKISEENCFINMVKPIEIDNIGQIGDMSTPEVLIKKVRDEGAVLIVPNNFKVMDDVSMLVRRTTRKFTNSLLHTNTANSTLKRIAGTNTYYHRYYSTHTEKPAACVNTVFIVVDIRYCLPFYEFNKHTGVLVIIMSLAYNEEKKVSNPLTQLSFFLSDSDEGLYVMDGEPLTSRTSRVSPEHIDKFMFMIKNTTYLSQDQRKKKPTYIHYDHVVKKKPKISIDNQKLVLNTNTSKKYTFNSTNAKRYTSDAIDTTSTNIGSIYHNYMNYEVDLSIKQEEIKQLISQTAEKPSLKSYHPLSEKKPKTMKVVGEEAENYEGDS